MPYLRQEDILRPTTTAEQSNFINWFYSYFNIGGKVAHRTIVNVEPLFYQGVIAGTEFLVYSTTKLYLSLNTEFAGQLYNVYLGSGEMQLYNENNVASFRSDNYLMQYVNAGLELATYNNSSLFNSYYSRIDPGVLVTYIKFDGYRITLN
jgi:hypothetical protein